MTVHQQNQMNENQFHLKKDENAGSPNVFLIIFQLLVWFMLIYTFLNPDFFPLCCEEHDQLPPFQ